MRGVNIIKFNPTHLLTSEIYFSFERSFGKHRIEAGAGLNFRIRPLNKFIEDNYFLNYWTSPFGYLYWNKGFTVRVQYKYTLNKRATFYVSPLIMFKYFWEKNEFPYDNHNNIEEIKIRSDINVYAFEILFGNESFKTRKLLFDIYFGLGIRYSSERFIITQNSSNNDISPGYGDSGLFPTIHLGINIGLRMSKDKESSTEGKKNPSSYNLDTIK